jgi:hypothetical protein
MLSDYLKYPDALVALDARTVALAFWLSGAEAPASSVASASCYRCSKDVRILPMVVAELKFRKIERQVLLGNIVIGADDSTLQQCPKRIEVSGMNAATDVFAVAMVDGFVREAKRVQVAITAILVGRHQIYFVADYLADETVESSGAGVFNDLTEHISLPANSADDANLAARTATHMEPFIGVLVLFLAANVHLVDFDDPYKLFEFFVVHRGAKSLADVPRGMHGRTLAKEHAPNLARRNPLFTLEHRVEHFEPSRNRDVRILENGADQYRESIGAMMLVCPSTTEEIEGTRRAFINLDVSAFRTDWTARPAPQRQILATGDFIGKLSHELLEGVHA